MGAEKITFKQMKRKVMSRTGKKNEMILTCPFANRLQFTRLKEAYRDMRIRHLWLPNRGDAPRMY